MPCCSVCFAACTVAEHRYRCKFVANYAMEYLASQIMMVPCSAGLARRRTAHALSKARLSRGTRCLPSAQTRTPHTTRPPDSPQGGLTAKRPAYLFGTSRFAPVFSSTVHKNKPQRAARSHRGCRSSPQTQHILGFRRRCAFGQRILVTPRTWGSLRGGAVHAAPRTSRTSPSRRAWNRRSRRTLAGTCWKRNAG